jgi:predicted amidophosphoribosyltransferase
MRHHDEVDEGCAECGGPVEHQQSHCAECAAELHRIEDERAARRLRGLL